MMYAHIFNDFGKFRVKINRWIEFKNSAEKDEISKNLVATISEETGDELLLEKKVLDYAINGGLRIEGYNFSPRHLELLKKIAELPDSDRIEMLKIAVSHLSSLLMLSARQIEDLREEKAEISRILLLYHNAKEASDYLLSCISDVVEISEAELQCEHIEPARGIYWDRRSQTDN